jgi:hypothetical protein
LLFEIVIIVQVFAVYHISNVFVQFVYFQLKSKVVGSRPPRQETPMSESESDPPRSPRSPTPPPPPRGDLDRDPTPDLVELPHMTPSQRKKSKRQAAEDEQDDRFLREIRQRDNRARDMQRQLTTYLARSADKPADTTERVRGPAGWSLRCHTSMTV